MTATVVQADPDNGITKADRPADCLPADPVVSSPEDVNKALREMAFMTAHAEQVNARRTEARRKLDQVYDAELLAAGPDGDLSYQNREMLLLNAIEKFANKEFAAIREGKTKRSVKLTAGVIKWQKARDAVDYLENKSAKTLISLIDKQLADGDDGERGLLKRVNDLLQRTKVKLCEKLIPLAALVKLEPSIEKTRLREAYESGIIDLKILDTLGVAFVEGEDYFKAEPNKYEPPDVT